MARLILRAGDLRAIARAGLEALPREACGLLIGRPEGAGDVRVTGLVASANVAAEPDRFEIDPALLLDLQRRARAAPAGDALVGLYHSHPNGRLALSARDRAEAAMPGLVWLITALERDRVVGHAAFRHVTVEDGHAAFEAMAVVPLDD